MWRHCNVATCYVRNGPCSKQLRSWMSAPSPHGCLHPDARFARISKFWPGMSVRMTPGFPQDIRPKNSLFGLIFRPEPDLRVFQGFFLVRKGFKNPWCFWVLLGFHLPSSPQLAKFILNKVTSELQLNRMNNPKNFEATVAYQSKQIPVNLGKCNCIKKNCNCISQRFPEYSILEVTAYVLGIMVNTKDSKVRANHGWALVTTTQDQAFSGRIRSSDEIRNLRAFSGMFRDMLLTWSAMNLHDPIGAQEPREVSTEGQTEPS